MMELLGLGLIVALAVWYFIGELRYHRHQQRRWRQLRRHLLRG